MVFLSNKYRRVVGKFIESRQCRKANRRGSGAWKLGEKAAKSENVPRNEMHATHRGRNGKLHRRVFKAATDVLTYLCDKPVSFFPM